MKNISQIFFLFLTMLLANVETKAQVGINTNTPEQALDVNGKIKVGNDGNAPTEGAIRYNNTSKKFEGYNGSEWVSLSYEPTVYSYEQPISYSYTTRDVLLTFPDTLRIEKPGKYLGLFDITFVDLHGNTTTLSSDQSLITYFQIYNQQHSKVIGPDITGLPNGFQYFFRFYESIQFHRILDIPTANQYMLIKFKVNSNPSEPPPTSTYSISRVKMTAIKLN